MPASLRSIACLIGLGLFAAPARGELVSFQFGGYLAAVDASVAGDFQIGDPFWGTLSYERTTPDQLPTNPDFGIYYAVVSFSCTINGTHEISATEGRVNLPVGTAMDWLVDSALTGDSAGGMTPQFVNIPLYENPSNPMLTTDQLPGNPFPSMLDFGGAEFRIRFGPTSNQNEVRGPITFDGSPLPVERSSWGRVKAQY